MQFTMRVIIQIHPHIFNFCSITFYIFNIRAWLLVYIQTTLLQCSIFYILLEKWGWCYRSLDGVGCQLSIFSNWINNTKTCSDFLKPLLNTGLYWILYIVIQITPRKALVLDKNVKVHGHFVNTFFAWHARYKCKNIKVRQNNIGE